MSETSPRIEQLALPLYGAKGWMKFLGALAILYGVLTALSVVGLLIAWLPIWMGVLLYQAANAVEAAVHSEDAESLTRALAKLRTYFVIMGVLALIGLVVMLLGVVMGLGMGLHMGGEMGISGGRVM